jgi:uncharacterized protein YdeI (YjbR/CyaY-like superfamily)
MLSKVISENPQLKRMIIDQPQELIKNLDAAPDLKKMFEGVDIKQNGKDQYFSPLRTSDLYRFCVPQSFMHSGMR